MSPKQQAKSCKPSVVSFFSGCGGMDEGFKAAGFKILACMDIEEWACDTLRVNNADTVIVGPPTHSGDIKAIPPKKFQDLAGIRPESIDVFTGGPPCQPFSQAASQRFLKGDERFKRKGFDDFEKGTLLFDYVKYIEYFLPKVFLLENVPGLIQMDGGRQLNHALERLTSLGYSHTTPAVLEAADYGVPQYRKRVIVWGTRIGAINPVVPQPTHCKNETLFQQPFNTVAHALSGISSRLSNHIPREHKNSSVARYRTLEFGKREKLGRVDRLDPKKPSKTVIAGGMNGGGRSHLHPFIARTLTVRECARLQTFSDDFVFQGNMSRQFTQVGNAVPPLLAEHFAREIGASVFGMKFNGPLQHETFMKSGACLDVLVEQLLTDSQKERPDWIYNTHAQTSIA